MQSKKEISDWENKFRSCASARQPFEEQWYYNLAFYFGRQWAVWEKGTLSNRLIEPPTPRNRVRLVSNKVKKAVRYEMAKLGKSEPVFYVVPNTTEASDIAGARVGENIAEYAMTEGHLSSVRRRAIFWVSTCGNGFIKTTCDGLDKPIDYDPLSPFHLFVPNIQEETIEKQPYIIIGKAVTPDVFWDKYHIEVKPDSIANGSTLEQRFFNAIGIKTNNQDNKNLTYVKEIWVKPCRNYPTGALLVIADGKMAYAYSSGNTQPVGDNPDSFMKQDDYSISDYPYQTPYYPIVKIDNIPSGRFYADSPVMDLIPLQKEYNRTRSQIIESKNRTAKPQLTYEKGSLDPSKFTSEPGLMIPINPGFNPPKYLQPADLPSYVHADLQICDADMNEVASKFSIPGVMAASAIAQIAEENDSVYHAPVTSIEEAMQGIGMMTLSHVSQFWTDAKIIKSVSRNNSFELMQFRMSDMNGNTDIRVESGSMIPQSRAGKQAFITELMKDGFLDPQKGLRYLQMNETNRLYEEMQSDARHAQRENWAMSVGSTVTVNIFDEDQVHLYEHGLYMKTQEYELLGPVAKQNFLMHYADTKTAINNKMLEQQALMMQPVPTQPAESPK